MNIANMPSKRHKSAKFSIKSVFMPHECKIMIAFQLKMGRTKSCSGAHQSFVTPRCHRCYDAHQSMKEHEPADGEAPSLRTLDAYIMGINPLYISV